MTVRVLLVDDQEPLRDALATVLGADPRLDVVGSVGDGSAAVEFVRAHRVDVVLMDIRMPGMDGITATAEILASRSDVRVLVLTTFDLDEYVYAAIEAGASGFLTKDVRPGELADAICRVADGDAAIAPRASALLLQHVRRTARRVADPMGPLTAREREVAMLLARGASNDDVCRTLYLTENTVKTHVKAVLAKLGLRDRVHVVIWAYENGVVEPRG